MPVSMETLGSWAPMGLKFVKDIGARITDAHGDKRSTSFLFQAIGIATQRGNSSFSKKAGRTLLFIVANVICD